MKSAEASDNLMEFVSCFACFEPEEGGDLLL
jgi:hypothetical protein